VSGSQLFGAAGKITNGMSTLAGNQAAAREGVDSVLRHGIPFFPYAKATSPAQSLSPIRLDFRQPQTNSVSISNQSP
jgi:hypothetical protein